MSTSSHNQRDSATKQKVRPCWCGNTALTPFSENYARCRRCETLVLVDSASGAVGRVVDDARDFYGRDYWFGHQLELGHIDIEERARRDLSERCLHWLRAVLKYRRPPGSALELGCAHGGFVALLRESGFDARGLELSPAIAEYARRTFGVSVLVGPIEDQELPSASLDLILAMDVLEHLTDPLETVNRCAELLRPDGVFVFQTPCYPGGMDLDEVKMAASSFEDQLRPQEHIYLFSQPSMQTLLERLGFEHVVFEPAIFAHYDMFVVASRVALPIYAVDESLAQVDTRSARIVQALLDLEDQVTSLKQTLAANSADIAHLTSELERIQQVTSELERIQQDGIPPGVELDQLRHQLRVSEADRAARLEVIERQGAEVAALSGEVDRWLREAQQLYVRVNGLEGERHETQAELSSLYQQFQASESDRSARLDVIQRQGAELVSLSAEVDRWLRESQQLWPRVTALEAERHELQSELVTLRSTHEIGQLELARQREDLLRARSDVNRLQVRIALARKSRLFRILQRLGFLKVLSEGDGSTIR